MRKLILDDQKKIGHAVSYLSETRFLLLILYMDKYGIIEPRVD